MALSYPRMNLTLFTTLMLLYVPALFAQSSLQAQPAQSIPKLFVDPSSSRVSLGKATLTVNPLNHKGALYVGDYQLNVVPYFFMGETGVLQLDAPDDVMHKLLGGMPVAFTGIASNNKHGKPKIITGKITPAANDHGDVTFSVQTDNGPMIFNTSYHLSQ